MLTAPLTKNTAVEMSTATTYDSGLICFAPKYNKILRRDADEFRREAADSGGVLHVFDNRIPKQERRLWVYARLAQHVNAQAVAFFCHGWRTGMQAGFDLGTINRLADAITLTGAWQVILYACRCADGPNNGEGSFASMLRYALVKRIDGAVDVFAHQKKGHTTANPRVIHYTEHGGGRWLVPRDSTEWSAWRKALKGDLRLRFWRLHPEALADAICTRRVS